MGRKLLATALVAAGLSLGLAGTAAAAPSQRDVSVNAVWHTYNHYWVLSDCEYAGRLLVAGGVYRAWACERDGARWALRVLD